MNDVYAQIKGYRFVTVRIRMEIYLWAYILVTFDKIRKRLLQWKALLLQARLSIFRSSLGTRNRFSQCLKFGWMNIYYAIYNHWLLKKISCSISWGCSRPSLLAMHYWSASPGDWQSPSLLWHHVIFRVTFCKKSSMFESLKCDRIAELLKVPC